jgi:hypothetical protein
MKRIRFVLLLLAFGMCATLMVVFHPAAQEVEDEETPSVSESDLDLYIKVYSAMQEDHDLTIDAAIGQHNVSLDDFRQIERRIQSQPRMVERVRQALLDRAKQHSVFAQSVTTPTPASTPGEHKTPHHKEK